MRFHSLAIIIALLSICASVKAEQLRVDHVVIAVHNLEHAVTSYRKMGFTIKPGRFHKNGLFNSHIKFADKTGLELMAVTMEPTDSISNAYSEFLQAGEGGAYIAFSGIKIQAMQTKLHKHNIKHETIRSRLWDYVVFPEESGIDHIFFIENHKSHIEEEWVYRHDNAVTAIKNIWIEGGPNLDKLLLLFGAYPCTNISTPDGLQGTVYRIENQEIIVVPPKKQNVRSRFLGVGLEKKHVTLKEYYPGKHGIFVEFNSNVHCNQTIHNKANAANMKSRAAD